MTKKEIYDALQAAIKQAELLNAKLDRSPDEDSQLDAAMALVDEKTAELEAVTAKEKADKERADKLAATRKTLGAATPVTRRPQPGNDGIGHIRQSAEDDPNAGFKTPREFLSAVMTASRGRADERLSPLRATAGSDEHGEYSDSYGGYLIPTGLLPGLKMIAPEGDPTASMVDAIPMASTTIKINARTDKDHSSSVTGGFRVYRRAETQDVASSRMQTEQVSLTAHSLMGVSYASEELLTDSPVSFAAMITNGFGEEIASKLLTEKLFGTGAGEFEGILNAPSLVTVSKETGQAAATIKYENLVKMYARAWRPKMWLANQDTLPQLMSLAFVSGTQGVPFWAGSARDGAPAQLLGLPIYFTESCETLGTLGDILLCNWSEYTVGTLEGVRSAESMHVRFLEHERTFKVWTRNDGKTLWRSDLTPKKGANTLSPFVALAARA